MCIYGEKKESKSKKFDWERKGLTSTREHETKEAYRGLNLEPYEIDVKERGRINYKQKGCGGNWKSARAFADERAMLLI